MRLLRFRFENIENDGYKLNPMTMTPIVFSHLNLLVGKNASGKSTIAQSAVALARMLKGSFLRLGSYEISINCDDGSLIDYRCSITLTKGVMKISESLQKDEVSLIERKDSTAEIFSAIEGKLVNINPPAEKLICQVRRDEKDYPYLEQLINWAEGVHYFKFGHIHTHSFLSPAVSGPNVDLISINTKDLNKILGELTEFTKEKVINDFNSLGYNIELLSIKLQGDQNVIFVKENGVKYEIHQGSLSQGMFRSLFLIIFLHHLLDREKSSMVIIDDLCEGLDYDRATKLGKLIFEILERERIQFLATSNDYFLMNVVDVKFWNIIYREGSQLRILNYQNSKDIFDRFKLSGLNNFDLFSSNYIEFS